MKKNIAICLAMLAAAALAFAQATPPDLVNFQGVLRDSADAPLDGAFDMTFRFYDAVTLGDQILLDTHTLALSAPVTVTGGLFNVALGSGFLSDGTGPGTYLTLTDVFRDYGAVWVEVVMGAEILSPRIRVVSAAYALNAENVGGISSGNFLRSDVDDIAEGVITFTAATTDVQGSLVDTVDSVVNVGDDLVVQGGNIGVGIAPNSSYGVYSSGSSYGGYFRGTTRGSYGLVNETSTSDLYGAFNSARNDDTGTSALFGTHSSGYAGGASNGLSVFGLRGIAGGISTSTGNHYGLYAIATDPTAGGVHYGVYGAASGGAANWGLYTPNDAYVGGTLDLGPLANDDLTAADVTELTDGGDTTLHTHAAGDADTLDTLDSLQFLRSDMDDTAAGAITFSKTIGVGVAPNSSYGVYSSGSSYGGYFIGTTIGSYSLVNENTADTLYGALNAAKNSNTGTGDLYGTHSTADATGTNNAKTVYGLRGNALGDATSMGNHYGLYAIATNSTAGGVHYGVYGQASGGATNYGGYFSGNDYGVRSVATPVAQTGYGAHNTAQNSDTGTGLLYGTYSTANALGTNNAKTLYGLSGYAIGDATSTGDHYGVYGKAIDSASGGTHYGVYGEAAGGATNWGLYTPNNAYVGGTLDLGGGTDDDLTASDVTELTGGTDTTLHSHDITGAGDARYLRKDIADTAAGVITFTAATTDVQGSLVDTSDSETDVGNSLHVESGTIGVGVAPDSTKGVYSSGSNYGGYFNGSQYGSYSYVDEVSINDLYGIYAGAKNADTSTSMPLAGIFGFADATGALNDKTVYGLYGYATGASDSTGPHYGVYGWAQGGDGVHYGVKGLANQFASAGIHYGVYGEAAGGATNWGLYTPNDAYVGGTLDLGTLADDDLTASDVIDLTDGGDTSLHVHTTDGDARYLRKDIADTAAGVITFQAATTDVRGSLVDNDTGDTTVNVGEDLHVEGGHIGVGTDPISSYGVYSYGSSYGGFFRGTTRGSYSYVNQSSKSTLYGAYNEGISGDTGTGDLYGTYSFAYAGNTGSLKTAYGLYGRAWGDATSTGNHYGVYGEALSGDGNHYGVTGLANQASSTGTHYGVYGEASGGATNWGLYTPNDAYVGGTLDLGPLADDDLTASDVIDLTDGGDTSLHVHTTDGDARYLRKDIADTAAGVITFTAPTTNVQGNLVDTTDAVVDVGDDLYVQGGHIGVGIAPDNSCGVRSSGSYYGGYFRGTGKGLYSYALETSTSTLYGASNYAENDHTGTGFLYGTLSKANAGGLSNLKTVYGLRGIATGGGTSEGDHYGVYGSATSSGPAGTHYGVYGEASGGATSWGLYTPNDAYVGSSLHVDTGTIGVGVAPDSTKGVYSLVNETSMFALYGAYNEAQNDDTGGGFIFGTDSRANASGAGNTKTVTGLHGIATGAENSTGDHHGVYGEAYSGDGNHYGLYGKATQAATTGTHYGVYGEATGGSTNWGLYTPNNAYIGGTLRTGIATPQTYNHIGSGGTPASGAMGNNGDLFVRFDIELGASAYLNKTLYMEGDTGAAADGDQTIYFYNAGSRTGEYFRWDDSEAAFVLSADLTFELATDVTRNISNTYDIVLRKDEDNDNTSTWFRFFTDSTIEQLRIYDGDEAAANFDGAVNANGIDYAEAFLVSDPTLEAGDIVSLVRGDPGRVERTGKSNHDQVVGVISANPGFVAGNSFTAEEEADPALAELRRAAAAAGDYELEKQYTIQLVEKKKARQRPVALLGRVPVKVDGSYGDIQPGDHLTSSPTPGHVMVMDRPGHSIGIALEGWESSEKGQILAFIQRKWHTPEGDVLQAEELREEWQSDIADSTPDKKTGRQEMDGNLQIVLDRDANDASCFSVFRDGADGLQEEVFRLDEEGNLRLKGAVMPNSLDLAEYHLVGEAVEAGDVLVADRFAPGLMRKATSAEDKAVVGVVSAAPGVALGAGVQRLAETEPELAAWIDEARALGDKEAEDAAWALLEEIFMETHAAVALSGTVACKADAGYGPIEVGDLLVTSPTAGHAMRADEPAPGTVLGKALEPLNAGAGTITVLVMLR